MFSVTAKQAASSGSESDAQAVIDQRKRKRMESNRESARRSRMKKQQHLDELVAQVSRLQCDNARVAAQTGLCAQQLARLYAENTVLRTQLAELTERLNSLNSVLRLVQEFSGVAVDIPELPDPLLKPWQLPCLSHPIPASADALQY